MNKINKVYWGFIVGIVAPLVAMSILYFGSGANIDFGNTDNLSLNLKFLSPFVRLSLVVNMIFFIPYGKSPKIKFLRGLIAATFIYGFIIIWIHFL